ncbi:MAG TPA: phage terminase large subunit [Terriglobia bacterium]|nr:phage terminase large subunit [Terriglobia bacterium]
MTKPTSKMVSGLKSTWENNFYSFAAAGWKILEPSREWRPTWYRKAIAEYLQAMWAGEYKRLLITVPPQSGKSTLVTKLFPTWIWTRAPGARCLFASYSFEGLAVPMSIERRRLIESRWYQENWGGKFQLSQDDNLKWRYSNSMGGHHIAVTGATGIGGDLLIVDDPHSADEARSDTERQATVDRFDNTLMTRLTPEGRGLCVVVCQRLHERDLAGTLIEKGGWEHLDLGAEAEKPQKLFMPVSKRWILRRRKALLDSVSMPKEFLEAKRIELGPAGYSAQYQQRPAPSEGIIFNPAWWKRHSDRPEVEMIAISVDANFKAGRDPVAVHAWGFKGPKSYLIDWQTIQVGFVGTKNLVREFVHAHRANVVLIEEAANGAAIIEELSQEFPVVPITAIGSKEARAEAVAPQVAAGFVSIPEGARGDKFVLDAAKFPLGANDHDVDAMTQALNWRRQNAFGLMEYYRELGRQQAEAPESAERSQFERSAHTKFTRMPAPLGCGQCGHRGKTTVHHGDWDEVRCSRCNTLIEEAALKA